MGCKKEFSDVRKWESHYNSTHRHVCQYCGCVYPTSRFLDIHVLERHDTLFKMLAQKRHMYECLVPECGKKFAKNYQRQDHLVGVHKFPKSFRFHQRAFKSKYTSKKHNKMPETTSSIPEKTINEPKKQYYKKKSKHNTVESLGSPIATDVESTPVITSNASTAATAMNVNMEMEMVAESFGTVGIKEDVEIGMHEKQSENIGEKHVPQVISFGRRGRGRTPSRTRGMQSFYAVPQKKTTS